MSDLADTNPGGWVDHDGAPLTLRCGPSLWQPLRGRTRLPSLTHSLDSPSAPAQQHRAILELLSSRRKS
jgi:hypothetical protein